MAAAAFAKDSSKPFLPLAGVARDGWSNEDEATSTCFCGAVQLVLPLKAPGLVNSFVCNCYDCRKITGSMFASNVTVQDSHVRYTRGQDQLKAWRNETTIGSGEAMTNYFCGTCGGLMYRVGDRFPGLSFLRMGPIDDFNLHETKLRPQVEQYTADRVSWFHGVEGAEKFEKMSS
ncbi:hypothetical protein JX265_009663 [Neoarthrinium moseri]|uniref:CENP-V/GFA domain-containing protein n=1 Tax=Neoarthrinium moseri TaxID=1658444 RepID=A0A9P9WFR4_9PEZI|nr:uncharacterized protein JN550_010899 [Neoarthrinium moseri]KAI1844074.1 hypothetical protein JX266_009747 [Neoarthrinium moseri]KAI1861044.1 hypothetical protein JX265_009663 [Neoarthrinium moseri]KAI1861369.1 hypothetical protein JN550_010899 [Neoarthrinium moseri]